MRFIRFSLEKSVALVKLFGNLRQIAGTSSLTVDGNTVGEILGLLKLQNNLLVEAFMDQTHLRPYFKIMVNGLDLSFLEGLTTPTKPGDVIAIFPPIAGGSSVHIHKGRIQWH